MKIAFAITNSGVYRNFIDSGSLREISSLQDLHLITTSSVPFPEGYDHSVLQLKDVGKRYRYREFFNFLSMKRYDNRAKTFPIKFRFVFWKNASLKRKIAASFFSIPFIYEISVWILEKILGTLPEIDHVIKKLSPDVIVIVSGGASDSNSIDLLKSAKKFQIPNLVIMYNWDNVSCKGVWTVQPEHFAVWGEQTRKFAEKILGIGPSDIHIIGAPHFEHHKAQEKKQVFPKDPKKTYILFPGSARYHSDIDHLQFLESEIELNRLPWVIVYRPHPWREFKKNEKSFFHYSFQHIMMDPQLVEIYQKCLINPRSNIGFVPELFYYKDLFFTVDVVICPLGTMAIESMIAGKPVVLMTFPDENFEFSINIIKKYDHHDCWELFGTRIECDDFKTIVSKIKLAVDKAKEKDFAERLKHEVNYVCFQSLESYSLRLQAILEEIMTNSPTSNK